MTQQPTDAVKDRHNGTPRRTVVVNPDDIVRALEYNHLKATDETRRVLVSLDEHRTHAEYRDLAPMDPVPSGFPDRQALINPSAFVRDSLEWAQPPARADIKSELDGSFGSEYEIDEVHARCLAGWRDQVRKRIEDSVLLDPYTGEIARVEVTSERK